MKRFNTNKKIKINYILIWITLVFVVDIIIFNTYMNRFSDNVSYIAKIKIDELTKYYLNSTIKKYLNVNTNDYIKTNIVNNNIVSVDIDNNNSNILLKSIISDLEIVVKDIESGNINTYNNLEMLKGDKGVILLVPTGILFNNALLSNIGFRIPIRVNFLENIDAYIDVVVENYGINNSLIKLYVIINIDEVLEIPIDSDNRRQEYKFLISSKLINGEVPSFLGGSIDTNSKIVKNNVK